MKIRHCLIFNIILCFFTTLGLAQNERISKMEAELNSFEGSDSVKFHMLDDLAWELRRIQPDKAMQYAQEALELAKAIEYQKGEGISLNMMGILYYRLGEYDSSLEYYQQALSIRKELGDTKAVGNTLDNIGQVYQKKGNYDSAVSYLIEALKIREEIGDKSGMASGYNNIGILYKNQRLFDKALEYYEKALEIERSLNDSSAIATNFNNIGSVHYFLGDFDEALAFYESSLSIRKAIDDKRGKISSYNNLGNVFLKKEDVPTALDYYLESLKISEEIGDKNNAAISYNRIGALVNEMGTPKEAINYLEQSLAIAKGIGSLNIQRDNFKQLAEIYENLASEKFNSTTQRLNYLEKALQYRKDFFVINDSLFSRERVQQVAELESKYEIEKHMRENERLKSQRAKEQAENEKAAAITRTITQASFVILALMGLLIFVLLRNNRIKKKANDLLQGKNQELINQKEEIASINENLTLANAEIKKKNDDITASINYAKRIQNAMFPDIKELDNSPVQEHFVMLKPRDIVSGDFYWFDRTERFVYLAAVDCTGHGVPGAILSMIGFEQLTEIVDANHVTDPGDILRNLQEGVRGILKQEETHNQDGMDVALCAIDLETNELHFAGAKRPLLVASKENGEIQTEVIKGDKVAIGGLKAQGSFTTHRIKLNKPTSVYLFSDGLQDQFGGPDNKKFMFKQIKDMVEYYYHLPMEQQGELFERKLAEWKGNRDQIDDVLMMGFRLVVPQTAAHASAESSSL